MAMILVPILIAIAAMARGQTDPVPTTSPTTDTTNVPLSTTSAPATSSVNVKDMDRACPVGYFYAGETTEPVELEPNTTGRDFAARRGPRSQVYSCYLIHKGPFTWAEATKKCGDEEDAPGTLLSVNNYGEYSVLTGDMFLQNAFGMDGEGNVTLPTGPTITSGVSLAPDSWTWFGAGSNTSAVNSTIVDSLNSTVAEGSTACLAAEFRREGEVVVLKYSAVACVDSFPMAICEVRVYEQTWYVWFTTNWLQILFLLTLVLLLVSSCVTFQIWVSRPSRRARVSPRRPDSPPAYSPREEEHPPTKARLATDAAKYMEKGKDILAKVVFYRKPEDKQRLHPTA